MVLFSVTLLSLSSFSIVDRQQVLFFEVSPRWRFQARVCDVKRLQTTEGIVVRIVIAERCTKEHPAQTVQTVL